MRSLTQLLVAAFWIAVACPASSVAAEPVFPQASAIGLVPPQGMVPSSRFRGFAGPDGTSIVLTELPAAAFNEVSAGFTLDRLRSQGFTSLRRETVQLGGREAVLLRGEQTTGRLKVSKWILVAGSGTTTALVVATRPEGAAGPSEAELRAAVLSTALRQPASLDDQVAALPFRVGNPAGFRLVSVLAGSGLILTDGPKDVDPRSEQPTVIVASSLGQGPSDAEADAFGRRALASVASLTGIEVEQARTITRDGATWHETLARAAARDGGQRLVVLQSIRLAPDRSGYLRVLGMGPDGQRDALLPRLRQVAASVAPN